MFYAQNVYDDQKEYCEEFIHGLKFLKNYSINKALACFQRAYESVSSVDLHHNKYASYCGLLRVLAGDVGGRELCRDAARAEHHDGDVYLNLACVEWHMHRRRNSILVVEKGLKIDKKHSGLKRLRNQIGVRKRNIIPFLARNNFINKMLGAIKRKKTMNRKQWDLPHIFR